MSRKVGRSLTATIDLIYGLKICSDSLCPCMHEDVNVSLYMQEEMPLMIDHIRLIHDSKVSPP